MLKTVTEMSEIWDLPETKITYFCRNGRVEGAVKDGNHWMIPENAKKPVDAIVQEVIHGDWGNGADRKAKLEAAGYDYDLVQRAVNNALGASAADLNAVADKVIRGDFGNGAERKAKLEAAGYNYDQVQAAVNAKLAGKPAPAGDLDAVAKAVIRGEYGNGADRKAKLEAAGYDYNAVQARVNQLLK